MRYLGGKSRTASKIAAFLTVLRQPDQFYIEPFVGAGWVLERMPNPRQASDLCEDLILLYQAIQAGWQPPNIVALEESGLGEYARSGAGNHARGARNSCLRQRPKLEGCSFTVATYLDLKPKGALVYCDPPYQGTTQYNATKKFDETQFWETMREWDQVNTVIISEYVAPPDFKCVLEIPTKLNMHSREGKAERIERLFQWSLSPLLGGHPFHE